MPILVVMITHRDAASLADSLDRELVRSGAIRRGVPMLTYDESAEIQFPAISDEERGRISQEVKQWLSTKGLRVESEWRGSYRPNAFAGQAYPPSDVAFCISFR
jgi:hypothetical protein